MFCKAIHTESGERVALADLTAAFSEHRPPIEWAGASDQEVSAVLAANGWHFDSNSTFAPLRNYVILTINGY